MENNKHENIAIVLDGRLEVTEKLLVKLNEADYIIAVDRGLDHLHNMNVHADLLIGDLDTVSTEALNWAEENNFPQDIHSPDKDFTDGELAINKALSLGAKQITFYACFSEYRPDHMINMINLSQNLHYQGIETAIFNGNILALPLEGPSNLTLDTKDYFAEELLSELFISIVPDTDVEGLSYSGLKYDLTDAHLDKYSSLSLSNSLSSDNKEGIFTLNFDYGKLLVFILYLV